MSRIENIPLESIIFLDDLYPRSGFDNNTVARYRLALDNLPPIQITHEYILIDGYHRLMAHRIEQRETISAEIEQLAQEHVLWEAMKRNAGHGLQLSLQDKKRLARLFFSDSRTQAEIAAALSVNPSSISRWVKDLKQKQDEERNAKIMDMWLACHTQEEIAEAVGLSQKQVSVILADIRKLQLQETYIPDSLQLFNLWNFQSCDDRYGVDFPGRIPGQIVENVLYYYTEPFDTVVDPMAGGGTILDVCKVMYRRYRCYDIRPVRDDIKQHDIAGGFPRECNGTDLVFLDPPYWKQKQGDYSDDKTNFANMPSLDVFYGEMGRLFDNAHEILADGGHVCVIVGPTQSKGQIYDHAHEFAKMLGQRFLFVNRIVVPYTTQQAQGYHVAAAKEGRYMLKLYRDLLVFQKGS